MVISLLEIGWHSMTVHGVLVNKKTNPIFMSVLFATEVKLMSILSCCFARVHPSYLTESKDTPAISSHLMSKFFQLPGGLEFSRSTFQC